MCLPISRRKRCSCVIALDATAHCVGQEVVSCSYQCLIGVNSERSVGSGLRFHHRRRDYPQPDVEQALSVGFALE